jgi:geranylgeranyl diphosphate synthase type II
MELVPALLKEYGGMARARLQDYLPRAEPRRYLYDLVADYPARGGRALRPSICMAAARAFGRRVEEAVLVAVSIELIHNAMLIHDDIEDESEQRRGGPTLHVREGTALAVNAGDALSLLSLRPLLDAEPALGPRLTRRLLEETGRMALESAEGQALDIGWRRDNAVDVSESDYLRMVMKKTCWLTTIHPLRVGALLGSHGAADVDPFIQAGFLLGAAFQIQDDLLNLEGDARSYGKELGGDLHEGKRTLMLIRLFRRGSPRERARLQAIYTRPRAERDAEDVRWVRRQMDRHGCIEHARRAAHALAGAAREELSRICRGLPDTRERRFIEALPAWVIERR